MRRIIAAALAVGILLTETPASATPRWGLPTFRAPLLRQMARQAWDVARGLSREIGRPPAPVRLNGPDPIFGLVESPKQIWRYAQQGHAADVLRGLQRGRYLELPEVGRQYAELRLQVRELMLQGEKTLSAWDLRNLAEDSRTPAEMAEVLNYITRRNLQWRDMSTSSVLRWGQGKLHRLRDQEQPPRKQGPPGGPPAGPPPAAASPPPPPKPSPATPPRPIPPAPPTRSAHRTAAWAAATATMGGLVAVAKALTAVPLPPLLP